MLASGILPVRFWEEGDGGLRFGMGLGKERARKTPGALWERVAAPSASLQGQAAEASGQGTAAGQGRQEPRANQDFLCPGAPR